MRSLKLEQVAVVKFLTLEGSDSHEIHYRIKNIFGDLTLPKSKILKLHKRFLKEGLLGIKEEPLYEDVSNPEIHCEPFDLQIEIDTSQKEIPKQGEKIKKTVKLKKAGIKNGKAAVRKFSAEEFKMKNDFPNEVVSSSDRMKRKASIKATNTWRTAFKTIKVECNQNPILNKPQKNNEIKPESFANANEDSDNENNIVSGSPDFNLPFFPLMDVADSQILLESLHTDLNCLLCVNKKFEHRSRLKVHLHVHLKHSVALPNIRSLMCKKNCDKSGRGHYHCPLCPHVSSHTNRIFSHYNIHVKRRSENYPEMVNGENLASYMPTYQAKDRCTCVDPNDGVYLVQKTNFGSLEPIHVLKRIGELITDENVVVSQCSEELCELAMQAAKANGNNELECKHLRKVHLDADFQPQSFSLEEDLLENMHLSDQEKERCLSLTQLAVQKGSSLVVEWVADDTTIYFSVLSDAPFATLGRILVMFDAKENHFQCKCPLPSKSHFCVYKIIAEVYYKKEKLKNLNENNKNN